MRLFISLLLVVYKAFDSADDELRADRDWWRIYPIISHVQSFAKVFTEYSRSCAHLQEHNKEDADIIPALNLLSGGR